MLLYIYILWILAYITTYDSLNYRIPNYLILLLLPAVFYQLFMGSVFLVISRLLASLITLFVLHHVHMNGGDCKLAASTVLLLGFPLFLYVFLVMGLTAFIYSLYRSLVFKVSLHDPIPLGPFMNLGTVLFFCMRYPPLS